MAGANLIQSTINRLRRRSRQDVPQQVYQPPPGPPPSKVSKNQQEDDRLAKSTQVRHVELPLVLPEHSYNLVAQGWTTVTLNQTSGGLELQDAIQTLFAAGKTFFDREHEYKEQFLTQLGSEEGWSNIPGEKQFITIRSTEKLPEELREAATTFWSLAGAYLNEMLVKIAQSLEIQPKALTKFSEPCSEIHDKPTATMLRIFRYEGWEDKVVAEPHCDLGLLSLVAGNSPGLEVWNVFDQSFFPVEKSYPDLSSCATVLTGRSLQRLSNGKYIPGGHLVRSYPKPESQVDSNGQPAAEKRYRYSIVFVLRPHYPVVIDADSLTSRITGVPKLITDGMTAKDFFTNIRHAHYNINTNIQDREEQKRHIRERAPPEEKPAPK